MKKIVILVALASQAVALNAMDRKSDRPVLKPSAKQLAAESKSQKPAEKDKEVTHAVLDIGALLKTADLQAPNFYEYLEVITALEPTMTPDQSNYLRNVLLEKYEPLLRTLVKSGLDSMVLNCQTAHVTFSASHKLEGNGFLDILPNIDLPKNFRATDDSLDMLLSGANIASDNNYKNLRESRMVIQNMHPQERRNNNNVLDILRGPDSRKDWLLKNFDGKTVDIALPFQAEIYDIAMSSNGKYILAGSNNHSVYLWDRTNNKTDTLMHYGLIRAVEMTTDGAYGITGSFDQSLRVWHIDSKLSHKYGLKQPVNKVRLSADSKYLFVLTSHTSTKPGDTITIYFLLGCDLLKDLSLAQLLLLIKLIEQKDYNNELKATAAQRVYRTLREYPVLKQRIRNNLALKLIKNNVRAPNEIANLIFGYIGHVPTKKKEHTQTAAHPESNVPASGCMIA